MKRNVFALIFCFIAGLALAAPGDNLDAVSIKVRAEMRIRKAAMTVFENRGPAEAVLYLQEQLNPEKSGEPAYNVAVALMQIVYEFYNQGKLTLAQATGKEAVKISEAFILHEPDSHRSASLARSLGVMSEFILFDLDRAKRYYEISITINQDDPITRQKLKSVQDKAAIGQQQTKR